MSAAEEYNFNDVLNNIAQSYSLSKWQYSLNSFESIGQNYFGDLMPLHFTGTDCTGKDIKLSLVLKLAPTDKKFRLSDAVTRMFDREMFVYSVVLSNYQDIQKSLSTAHYVIPKCYYIRQTYCEEAIVLQDMREDGYTSYSEETFLDLDHMVASVSSLAKFHALSFILKQRNKKLYTEIQQKCVPISEKNDKRFLEVLNDRLIKALVKFSNTDYIPLLTSLKQNCAQYINNTTELTAKTCITHGDIWKENILFKYKVGIKIYFICTPVDIIKLRNVEDFDEILDSKPIEACIIDYQTARTCSPAYDVLYLITTSTDSAFRQRHFGYILDKYYETFDNYIRAAGYDAEMLYPRELLDNDLRVVAPACLIVTNTALWLSNGLQQEGHVRSKQILSTEEDLAGAVKKYTSVIKNIIDDFSTYGYLNI